MDKFINNKINKWPKVFPPLTAEQETISNAHMKYWLELMPKQASYRLINNFFNHGYVIRHTPKKETVEISNQAAAKTRITGSSATEPAQTRQ